MRTRAALAAGLILMSGLVLADLPAEGTERPLHPCASADRPCKGTISVPLDWSRPNGERIRVGFAWIPRTDTDRPATGTILAHAGGSGEAIPAAAMFRDALGPVLRRQNLLLVDARGWGSSSPVNCEGLDQSKPHTILECAQRLRDKAPWLSSDQIAADFDAVRKSLGVDKVTLFGNSRGTVFMQAYAVRYPRRTRAVALDSALALDDNGFVERDFHHDSYRASKPVLRLLCKRSAACRAQPGDPVARLFGVVGRLRAQPDPEIPLNVLFDSTSALLFDATVGSEFNAALSGFLRGDPRPLRRLARLGGTPQADRSPDVTAALALVCGETSAPYDRQADPIRRQRQLDAFYRRTGVLAPFGKAELPVAGTHNCVYWPTPRHSPVVPPDATYPELPVLVIGGNLDTTTPVQAGREIAERFPNGVFVETDFGRHGDSLRAVPDRPSTCVRRLLHGFLAAPHGDSLTRASRSCSGETYVAHGRFPRTSADVPPARGVPAVHARWIAAGFATASDAALRWHPAAFLTTGSGRVPGLRGGQIHYDRDSSTIRLDGARFVSDVPVDGTITLESPDRARADLTVHDPVHGKKTLGATWSLTDNGPVHRVRLDVDGLTYHGRLPRF